jgi:hypothetical protein
LKIRSKTCFDASGDIGAVVSSSSSIAILSSSARRWFLRSCALLISAFIEKARGHDESSDLREQESGKLAH